MDESMVMVCMQIITNTGSAKSSYIEAIQKAKKVSANRKYPGGFGKRSPGYF